MRKNQRPEMDADLVSSLLIPHTAYEQGRRRLQRALENVRRGTAKPDCFAIIGEYGVGKSELLKELLQANPTYRTEAGLVAEVIYVEVPGKPRVKALASLILKQLGDPMWASKEPEFTKTERILLFAAKVGLKVLCLDEFQHFFDKATALVQFEVSDWLKHLINANQFSIVLAGLEESTVVLKAYPQLRDRFQRAVRLPRFDWRKAEDREEWMQILAGFHIAIAKQHDLAQLYSKDLAFRLYLASAGSIRRLRNILHKAVESAALDKQSSIGVPDLANAYREAIDCDMKLNGRAIFDMSFIPAQPHLAVEEALALARESDIPHPPSWNSRKSKKMPSATQAFLGK